MRLIVVNVAVFALIRVAGIAALIGGWSIDGIIDRLALSSDPETIESTPWTPLTYMFLHYDVLHILANMLCLYWFGKILLYVATQRQIVALYIMGGLGGALAYLAVAQLSSAVGGWLLGASASVMAIMVGAAMRMPDLEVRLILIGNVKIKWLAVATVAMFALGLTGNNASAHVAHLGGVAIGLIYGALANRGIDMTRPLNRLIDVLYDFPGWIRHLLSGKTSFGHAKKGARQAQKKARQTKKSGRQASQWGRPTGPEDTAAGQRQASYCPGAASAGSNFDTVDLDAILDKIKRSGYSALTNEERETLFNFRK